jgi:hypothetical protein
LPPGQGGGEGLAYGRTGQGLLIPSRTDAAGRPWSVRTTPAHGDERAQVLPRLETLHVRTGKRGRPRQQFKVLAADNGDDAKDLRPRLRSRGRRAQIPKRLWNTTHSRGRPIKQGVPRHQAERPCAWVQRKYRRWVGRWERLCRLLQRVSGSGPDPYGGPSAHSGINS